MASKHRKLDLAAAMIQDLETHEPMGPRLDIRSTPQTDHVAQSRGTDGTASREPLRPLSNATSVQTSSGHTIQGSHVTGEILEVSVGTLGRSDHATDGRTYHATEEATDSRLPPSRQGMCRISGYFSPRVLKQVRLLAATQDRTVDELVGRALNMLFVAEGLPAIAFDDKDKGRGSHRPPA